MTDIERKNKALGLPRPFIPEVLELVDFINTPNSEELRIDNTLIHIKL